jgi:hypothetical protein
MNNLLLESRSPLHALIINRSWQANEYTGELFFQIYYCLGYNRVGSSFKIPVILMVLGRLGYCNVGAIHSPLHRGHPAPSLEVEHYLPHVLPSRPANQVSKTWFKARTTSQMMTLTVDFPMGNFSLLDRKFAS